MITPSSAERWTIRRYGSVTSTMDVAAQLIADGEAGYPTAVVADDQTAGRGRADRVWRSVPGGSLQVTAILALPLTIAELGPVPLLVGTMVAEAIEALDDRLKPTLKWPNDVLIEERKVAGILIVSRSTGGSSLLQIGIGVNIADPQSPGSSSVGLGRLVGTGSDETSCFELRDRLLDQILARLDSLPLELAADGGAGGLRRWARRATMVGEMVRVRDGDRMIDGMLLGVDRTGALRIETGPGQIRNVVAGDLTRGPQPLLEEDPIAKSEGIA